MDTAIVDPERRLVIDPNVRRAADRRTGRGVGTRRAAMVILRDTGSVAEPALS
jgi:hypothetical protein